MLCVSFSSKSKATCDKSIQARKKIILSYDSKELFMFLIKNESMWRREIKEQALQLTLLYCGKTVRSSHQRGSIKKAVLRNFTISLGNTCVRVSFLKSCRSEGLQLY